MPATSGSLGFQSWVVEFLRWERFLQQARLPGLNEMEKGRSGVLGFVLVGLGDGSWRVADVKPC